MGAGSGSVVRRSPFPVGDRWTVPRRSPLVIGGPFPGGSVDRSPVDRWTVRRDPCAAIVGSDRKKTTTEFVVIRQRTTGTNSLGSPNNRG
jgi:hypothetical protein